MTTPAITLANLAKIETDVMKKGVMMTILRECKLMEYLKWQTVSSLTNMATYVKALPDAPAFRRIGEGYSTAQGDVDQVWESVYGFGMDINYDKVFEKLKNTIVDPKVLQTQLALKAMSYRFNDYFINGDHASDPDGFEGLKKRVANSASRQTVYGAASSGASLDVTGSTANVRAFLNKVEEAHYKCNGGKVGAIFVNEGMYYGFGRALRYGQIAAGGMLDITKDTFDREVVTYKGAPFVDVGYKIDLSTEIISESEVDGNGASVATSMYFVSFETDEGLSGIQLNPLEVYDPLNGGEQESTPSKLLRIDWWCGLASLGKRSIVRLCNFESPSNWTNA